MLFLTEVPILGGVPNSLSMVMLPRSDKSLVLCWLLYAKFTAKQRWLFQPYDYLSCKHSSICSHTTIEQLQVA